MAAVCTHLQMQVLHFLGGEQQTFCLITLRQLSNNVMCQLNVRNIPLVCQTVLKLKAALRTRTPLPRIKLI